ncbi:hypothetical protein [Phascolarctobacterium faecium]|uniref:hypothetical protein n=1 Tax=Phascolarctobacterium faecium TaxID=33025 RepID=UPI00300E7170
MRLIDADALKEKFQECINSITVSDPFITGVKNGYESAEYVPTVEERKHGHWEGGGAYYCSNCNAYAATDVFGGGLDITEQHYCYNCGAIMDGKVGDDK